eukprot:1138752-Ditylum_brightwellii.AAC.1
MVCVVLLANHCAHAIVCTKSKNDGGVLLYGNSDWEGGWIEVHNASAYNSSFGLMFEMDCDDPSR